MIDHAAKRHIPDPILDSNEQPARRLQQRVQATQEPKLRRAWASLEIPVANPLQYSIHDDRVKARGRVR